MFLSVFTSITSMFVMSSYSFVAADFLCVSILNGTSDTPRVLGPGLDLVKVFARSISALRSDFKTFSKIVL